MPPEEAATMTSTPNALPNGPAAPVEEQRDYGKALAAYQEQVAVTLTAIRARSRTKDAAIQCLNIVRRELNWHLDRMAPGRVKDR
jgi:hypothetical protein